MKKNFLGIAAVIIAISASAFTAPRTNAGNKKLVSYKWFQISGNRTASQSDSPTNATFLSEGETPPAGTGCGGSTYQCVSGFNASQVTGSNQLNGTQMPQVIAASKN